MTNTLHSLDDVAQAVLASPRTGHRRVVALAGAPASGKSTLAKTLAGMLCAKGCATQIVPMDGFHLDNQILSDRGLLNRKGAPETFDALGLVHLVSRLQSKAEVFYPTFDRARDIALAAAGVVDAKCDTVIVEGNYLLYDAPVWRDLMGHWDLSVYLDVPEDTLRERLIARWLTHGLSRDQAELRAAENDLPNARSISQRRLPADIILRSERTLSDR
ncbi:nucleoside/nucleotide kinase family protein [Falsiphaeobacter marinintestinus]|uniref:nucleoside/nucleotide kinase family protein n=1 Tax=Falsiphaeobacter marinintestinus TaxID=1492905 RepID=UPI0011B669A6|nr:nucleoside/nucleotide kinase family protein [Phaeobacter marinintestinus]